MENAGEATITIITTTTITRNHQNLFALPVHCFLNHSPLLDTAVIFKINQQRFFFLQKTKQKLLLDFEGLTHLKNLTSLFYGHFNMRDAGNAILNT